MSDSKEKKRRDPRTLRQRVASWCMGDRDSLSENVVECLEDAFFAEAHQGLRDWSGQERNICFVDEAAYDKASKLFRVASDGRLKVRRDAHCHEAALVPKSVLARGRYVAGSAVSGAVQKASAFLRSWMMLSYFLDVFGTLIGRGWALSSSTRAAIQRAVVVAMRTTTGWDPEITPFVSTILTLGSYIMPWLELRPECQEQVSGLSGGRYNIPPRFLFPAEFFSSIAVAAMVAPVYMVQSLFDKSLSGVAKQGAEHAAKAAILGAVWAAAGATGGASMGVMWWFTEVLYLLGLEGLQKALPNLGALTSSLGGYFSSALSLGAYVPLMRELLEPVFSSAASVAGKVFSPLWSLASMVARLLLSHESQRTVAQWKQLFQEAATRNLSEKAFVSSTTFPDFGPFEMKLTALVPLVKSKATCELGAKLYERALKRHHGEHAVSARGARRAQKRLKGGRGRSAPRAEEGKK